MEFMIALTITVEDLWRRVQSLPLVELYELYLSFTNPENERTDDGYVDREIKVIQAWQRRSAIEEVTFNVIP